MATFLASIARLPSQNHIPLIPRYFWLVGILHQSQLPPQRNGARNIVSKLGLVGGVGKNSESVDANPRSVAARKAYELLQAGHRYLDVRTYDEFSCGHPSGAINIPYMFSTKTGMWKNPKFLEEVSSQFSKDNEIIIGCKSGRRSLMAAADLLSNGFRGVTDLAGGYSAWKENGLPIEK